MLLSWIIYFISVLFFVMRSCASVYWCLVVIFLDRADLLSLVCEVVTFPLLVSWVRCGTWLYRVLIFVLFRTWSITFQSTCWSERLWCFINKSKGRHLIYIWEKDKFRNFNYIFSISDLKLIHTILSTATKRHRKLTVTWQPEDNLSKATSPLFPSDKLLN